jgi:predicted phosphodiesterase
MHCSIRRALILGIALAVRCAWVAAPAEQWDFNGDLSSSTGGSNLVAAAAAPATAPGVTFTTATINGQAAQVTSFTRGTFFRMTHRLGANVGGAYLNAYTLIMDVMFPSRPSGWAVLWQTNPSNSNDGDWFINPNRGLGISGNYGGVVVDGTWNRIALVINPVDGTFTSYLNGNQVQQNTGITTDGRWSIGPVALLFADEDQENAAGFVNSVQLRDVAMTAADLASLGGATASGIPLPATPTLQLLSPNGGENLQAGSTQTVSWSASNPSGVVQIDLFRGGTLVRNLGQTAMRDGNFSRIIYSRIGDAADYRIRIGALSFPSIFDFSDAAFTIFGSAPPANPLFGQPLQSNGGFESLLANWQSTTGAPVALSASAGKGSPYAGTRFLHGGLRPGGDSVLRQEIDLLAAGFTASDIDSGAVLDAQAYLKNWFGAGTFDDQVFYRVAFIDAMGQRLNSLRCMVAGNNVWAPKALTGLVPPGTRKLHLEVVGQHRRDLDNDSMADEVTVRLQEGLPVAAPQITKLPMLQDVRQHQMRLLWETDNNMALHAVDWGRSNVVANAITAIETLQIDATHFVHRATIAGLETETRYVYRVRSGTAVSPVFSFRTAPRSETAFAVAWWGDNHDGTVTLRQHIANMLSHGPDLIAVAGDMVNNGNQLSEWHNYWFKPLEHLNLAQTTPIIFARGNHDGEHALAYAYSALPGNEAWFAFNYGNCRFIFLDSEVNTGGSPEQFAWLQSELARPETQNAAFRIVCFHRPPYANLWNGGGYNGELFVRTDWVPLFEQKNVDLVISGHAHNYNRGASNGVMYVVSGGGGGVLDVERVANWPLYTVEYSRYHYDLMEVDGGTLSWQVFDENNQLLDTFTLQTRIIHLEIDRSATAGLQLILSGNPGAAYVIESSLELRTWSPFLTNSLSATSSTRTNLIGPGAGKQFFRARNYNK